MGNWTVEPEVKDLGSESGLSVDDNPESDFVGTQLIPQSRPMASPRTVSNFVTISSDDDIPYAAQRQKESANIARNCFFINKSTGARKKTKTKNFCHPGGINTDEIGNSKVSCP
jgi:hypothetical protein